jgi:hypothetical protein
MIWQLAFAQFNLLTNKKECRFHPSRKSNTNIGG